MNQRHISFLVLIYLIIQLAACSTAKVRVLPGENGIHRVSARDIERDNTEEAALDAANEYCEKQNKTAVFLNSQEKTKYTGSMDESTRNTVRKASTAAMVLGTMGAAATHSTRIAGGALGGAGMVGHIMTSDRDYQSELQFKCK